MKFIKIVLAVVVAICIFAVGLYFSVNFLEILFNNPEKIFN